MKNEVVLLSNNGKKFMVTREQCKDSVLLETMLQDDEGDEVPEIPLQEINEKNLEALIEFLKHHGDNPIKKIKKPLVATSISEVVEEWDANFIETVVRNEESGTPNFQKIIEWYHVANYIDHQGLFDLVAAYGALHVRKVGAKNMYKELGEVEPSPEAAKEARFRPGNAWIYELSEATEIAKELKRRQEAEAVDAAAGTDAAAEE